MDTHLSSLLQSSTLLISIYRLFYLLPYTASINAIFKAADADDDYRTKRFLGWFIDEQAEEEKNASELITEYDLFGSDCQGLFLLDSKLKNRE